MRDVRRVVLVSTRQERRKRATIERLRSRIPQRGYPEPVRIGLTKCCVLAIGACESAQRMEPGMELDGSALALQSRGPARAPGPRGRRRGRSGGDDPCMAPAP